MREHDAAHRRRKTLDLSQDETGCFALPNPWDVGSAKALQHLGFKAIASTSAGFAWSIGRSDNHVTVEDVLQHLTSLCSAVDLR
jgi:2-methylisocitrate lyase-like PEP mutase family enzyme